MPALDDVGELPAQRPGQPGQIDHLVGGHSGGGELVGEQHRVRATVRAPRSVMGVTERIGGLRPQHAPLDRARVCHGSLDRRWPRGEPLRQVGASGTLPALGVQLAQSCSRNPVPARLDPAGLVRTLTRPAGIGRGSEPVHVGPSRLRPPGVMAGAHSVTAGQPLTPRDPARPSGVGRVGRVDHEPRVRVLRAQRRTHPRRPDCLDAADAQRQDDGRGHDASSVNTPARVSAALVSATVRCAYVVEVVATEVCPSSEETTSIGTPERRSPVA